MKLIKIQTLIIVVLVMLFAVPVFAAVPGLNEVTTLENTSGLLDHEDPPLLVAKIIQTIISFIGLVFVVLIIWSGTQWLTSNGNTEIIGKAKGRIINSIIGLIILIAAFGISEFVLTAIIDAAT